MFSDFDAASLCRSLYFFKGDEPLDWDFLDLSNTTTGIAWGVKSGPDGVDNLVFRGTSNIQDGLRDIELLPVTPKDQRYAPLGEVHGGFFEEVPRVVDAILARNPRGNIRLIGHSYGAAHAYLVSECLACWGIEAPAFLFGEPPSTKKIPRPARSWVNGGDIIAAPPFWPYAVRSDPLRLNEPPSADDDWPWPLSWHHVELYQSGLAKLQAPAPVIVQPARLPVTLTLTASQKTVCERIINAFETGSARGDYGCISIFHDGPHECRQITYGRSQTTEYGNLAELVQMYASAGGEFSTDLAPYAALVGKRPLVDDAKFKNLLIRAGREDPMMQETQDAFFDKRYFQPAQKWAEDHGFTLPLSMLVVYDSFVHSGEILPFLRSSFSEKTPSDGGDEKLWITAYVKARQNWLATNARTILHATVYRTQCFLTEIARGNWELSQLPIFAHGVRIDDAPFSHVPPAAPSITQPASKPTEPVMTAAATTAAHTAPVAATAGVNVSTASLVSNLIGTLMSSIVTIGAPLLGIMQGTTTGQYIAAGLFGIAGLGGVITHVYQMVTNNSQASNNTIAAINAVSSGAAQILATVQAASAHAGTAVQANPTPAAAS